jgi:hypothetical protein
MGISYDPAKNERNIHERGLSFERAADFDFETALIADYSRNNETRRVAVGCTCSATFPGRTESASSDFAEQTNKREAKLYGKPQTIA